MFRFASPEWLLALILVPILAGGFWLATRRRTRLLARFGDSELVAKLADSVSKRARWVKALLLVVGLRPFWPWPSPAPNSAPE